MSNLDLTTLFYKVDNFCKEFEPEWFKLLLQSKAQQRNRQHRLNLSEIMTIVIAFHYSGMRTFKDFYLLLPTYDRGAFPGLLSYSRFITVMKICLLPLFAFVKYHQDECTGISFIDATPIVVCHNKRISSHKVFDGIAKRGKSSMGWFFGFKLHIVVNHFGGLLAFKLTAGNVHDITVVEELSQSIFGKLFGDKGYISAKLFEKLLSQGVQLITKMRANMKGKLMPLVDKILLKKRSLVESVYHQMKDVFYVEHTRHRNPINFLVNMLSGLAAYCLYENKPKIRLDWTPSTPILGAP